MGITSRLSGVTLVTAALGLSLAGCGSSGPGTPALNLAVTVPVNGASVLVRTVRVVGEVSANQTGALVRLRVHGHRVRVRPGGRFEARVELHRGTNRIRVVAFAHGYPRALSVLTVRFRPGRPKAPPSLRAEVDAVCVSVLTRDFATTSSLTGAPSLKTVNHLVGNDQLAVNRLERISPPAGKAVLFDAFVASLRGTVSGEEGTISGLQAHSLAQARRSVLEWQTNFKQFQKLGARLGSAQCLSY